MLLIRRLEKYVNIPVDVDVWFYFRKYKIEEGNFEISPKDYAGSSNCSKTLSRLLPLSKDYLGASHCPKTLSGLVQLS